jgi:hypothetical protein
VTHVSDVRINENKKEIGSNLFEPVHVPSEIDAHFVSEHVGPSSTSRCKSLLLSAAMPQAHFIPLSIDVKIKEKMLFQPAEMEANNGLDAV